jgi:hypothetical protein
MPIISRTIPRRVQVLGVLCFATCHFLSSVSFEHDSELRCIESWAFSHCCFTSITIPPNVKFIDESAFLGTSQLSIPVQLAGSSCVVQSYSIVDFSERRLIRYFGNQSNVRTPRRIERLC